MYEFIFIPAIKSCCVAWTRGA